MRLSQGRSPCPPIFWDGPVPSPTTHSRLESENGINPLFEKTIDHPHLVLEVVFKEDAYRNPLCRHNLATLLKIALNLVH